VTQKCKFSIAACGEEAEATKKQHPQRKEKCMFCCSDYLKFQALSAKRQGAITQSLKKFAQFDSRTVHDSAVAFLREHVPPLIAAAIEKSAEKPIRTKVTKQQQTQRVATMWEGALTRRKRALADPTRTEIKDYQQRAEKDLAYVRNKFFPRASNKRRRAHEAWPQVPPATDAPALEKVLKEGCASTTCDETGIYLKLQFGI
jgi:hypothetical protein